MQVSMRGILLQVAFVVMATGGETLVLARQDLIPGSRYTSGRAAALGDAYLPLGDDPASGLFYNPATLSRIRRVESEPLNLTLYGNSNYFSNFSSASTKVTDLSQLSSTLQSKTGQIMGAGGSLLPTIAFPGFAMGILMQSQVNAVANDDQTITYRSLYQFVPTVGTGFKFLKGAIRVGYSLQWVSTTSGTRTVDPTSDLGYKNDLNEGSAFSHNFGLGITLPIKNLPSLNLVVRNAFGAQYRLPSLVPMSSSNQGAPGTEPMTFDASFSMQPRMGQGVSMNLVFQDRDITNQSGATIQQHLCAGMELSFREKVFLRGGYWGGYPTAGLGLKRKGAEMSLTWYTEELGTSTLRQSDARYMLQYQIRTF